MKRLLILAALLVFLPTLADSADVPGYTRKDGTYVGPYQRSTPDDNPYNNYNFPGNYNPNKGQITPGDQNNYLERYREQQRQNDLKRQQFYWKK
jgi:hypothetical protein